MVAEDVLWSSHEHTAVIDAKMHVIIHRVSVEAQIERVGLEKIMIDQRDKGKQDSGDDENRRQSNVMISLEITRH